jgi:CheY-like chemotaxis protein
MQLHSSTDRRAKILVIDDEPIMSAAIRRTLHNEHDVTVAASGREALELISKADFDLILSDVLMPEISGIDLYELLRVTHPSTSERMVFITGGAFTPVARDFLASVPNATLEKPFEPEKLRALVRDHLG